MQHFYGTAELCNYSEDLINESQKQLDLSLKNGGISFERKSLPVQIKPYIYSQTLSETCRNLFENFFCILKKTEQLYRINEKVQSYFNLGKWHHDLVMMKNPVAPFNQLCRFDFLFNEKNCPQIYETNTACPGGLLLTPIISSFAAKTPLYEFLLQNSQTYSWFPYQKKDYFVEVGTQAFYEMKGELPKVGLLNSRYNTLTNEMNLMADCLTRAGVENEVCFVEDLEYSDQVVYSPKKKLQLNVCFQKFDNALSEEQLAHFGANRSSVSAYLSAIRDGKIVAINPFSSHYLTEQKSILAFLHDNEMQKLFEPEERKLIEQIVPYTVLKAKAHVKDFYDKNMWVLKKSLDTRGRNVILGSETDSAQWLKYLDTQIFNNEDFVLQKRVQSEVIKEINHDIYISHAAFLVRGKYVGMFPRFSLEPLTNVGRNGFLGIPMLGRD